MARLTDADLKIIESLHIKVICDLRAHDEVRQEPDRFPDQSGIKYVHVPIKSKRHNELGWLPRILALVTGKARNIDFDKLMREIYREFVTNFADEFSQVLKLITDSSNLPILIHCKGGKDRTGFACALIHSLLDVPAELIEHDYLQTNDSFKNIKEALLVRLNYLSFFGISKEKLLPFFEARTAYLEAAFDQIEMDYGYMQNYFLKGLNIAENDVVKIQNNLQS